MLSEYLSNANEYKENIREKSRTRGWNSHGLSGSFWNNWMTLNSGIPAEIRQIIPNVILELRQYLLSPESDRINGLTEQCKYD